MRSLVRTLRPTCTLAHSTFPYKQRQNCGINHVVSEAFLFPADGSLCTVLSAIMSQCFHLVTILKFVANKISL
jgi:hypothetical protein